MWAVLRQRNVALLWVGGLISIIGDRTLMAALPFYVYQQTGSTLATAALFAASALPPVVLGSLAGVFVDRWKRKRLMVVVNLLQAVAILMLLFVRSAEWLWVIYLVFFLETALSAFFQPAESALLPQLVAEKDLVAANSLNALNNNIARLVGPPLGGLVFGLFGLDMVAIIDSASFAIAAVLIALMRMPASPIASTPPMSAVVVSPLRALWQEWHEGMILIWRDRTITRLFVVAALTSLGGCMFDPLIAPWIQSTLGGSAVHLGLLTTSGAVGGLLGGLLLGRWGTRLDARKLFGIGTLIGGIVLLVMYNLTSIPLILAVGVLKSVPLIGSGVGLDTLFQTSVPDRYRGRIYGALFTSNALIGLIALGIAGVMGELVGTVPILSVRPRSSRQQPEYMGLLLLPPPHRNIQHLTPRKSSHLVRRNAAIVWSLRCSHTPYQKGHRQREVKCHRCLFLRLT